MIRLDMMKMKERNEMIKMKLVDMNEWMVGLDVSESGLYKIKLDDDNNVVECVKVDRVEEEVEKYVKEELGYEFWIGIDDYEYWNVEVDMDWDNIDEEDVFENGVLVVEDVSEDDFDDSGVLVYSYKGKYVFMSFDIGGSLGGIEVYDNLYDIDTYGNSVNYLGGR